MVTVLASFFTFALLPPTKLDGVLQIWVCVHSKSILISWDFGVVAHITTFHKILYIKVCHYNPDHSIHLSLVLSEKWSLAMLACAWSKISRCSFHKHIACTKFTMKKWQFHNDLYIAKIHWNVNFGQESYHKFAFIGLMHIF